MGFSEDSSEILFEMDSGFFKDASGILESFIQDSLAILLGFFGDRFFSTFSGDSFRDRSGILSGILRRFLQHWSLEELPFLISASIFLFLPSFLLPPPPPRPHPPLCAFPSLEDC